MSYIKIGPAVNAATDLTGITPVANGGTGSSTALNNNRVMVSASGKVVEASAITASSALVSDANGIPVASSITSAQLATTSYWTKYTVLYTDLATAGTTNNITLFTAASKTVIQGVVIKHSVAFSGGSLTSYTLSVGITGTLAKYIAAFDVFQAVSNTAIGTTAAGVAQIYVEAIDATTAIKVAAVGSHNLNTASAGSADIWVLTSILP